MEDETSQEASAVMGAEGISLWDSLMSKIEQVSSDDPIQKLYDIFKEVESFLDAFQALVDATCNVSCDGVHAFLDGGYIVPERHVAVFLGVRPAKTRYLTIKHYKDNCWS